MAWYVMKTVESMRPSMRSQDSRCWMGPFPTREKAEELMAQLKKDGVSTDGLIVEEMQLERER
jgi:hypothetical protein